MLRIGALGRIAPAVVAANLLAAPALLEGLPQQSQSRPAGATDFTTLSTRAEAARDAGRLDEAVSLYRKALAIRSTWKEGWWSLGTILYERDAYRDAAPAFRRLVSLDPKNGTAHLMLALCEYQLDDDASALANIQTAKTLGVQKERGLPNVLTYHEGMLLLRAGRYERAIETLRPLVRAGVDDESLELALGMGVLLIRAKDAPPPGSPAHAIVMRAGRAERRFLTREFADAKREYAALASESETAAFPNVHFAYGRFLLATEDPESGIQEILKEIEAHPDHVRALVQVASAYFRYDSAAGLPFARDAVKLAPDYPFGHFILGLLYFDTGDLERAIPEFETAVRMLPDEPQFQFALGNAYARAGRAEEAAQARAAFTRLSQKPASSKEDALRRLDLVDSASRSPNESDKRTKPIKPIKN